MQLCDQIQYQPKSWPIPDIGEAKTFQQPMCRKSRPHWSLRYNRRE